jgi:hypothetical protein
MTERHDILRSPIPIARGIGKNAGMSAFRLISVLLAAGLVLSACATQKHSRDLLQVTLYDYAGAIRWGNFGGAATFLDPEVVAKKPLSELEMKRYEQVQVTGYTVLGKESPTEGLLQQAVEIRLVNRHTQAERSLIDHQRWRYDAEARRWWLVSGLPNISESR